jgi:hypothetical protein
MTKVIRPEDANMAMKTIRAIATGSPSSTTKGVSKKILEIVRRIERVEKDGRTNRCR